MPTGAAPGKGDGFHRTTLPNCGDFRNEENAVYFLLIIVLFFLLWYS
jgi:hypothetical protein